MRPVHQRLHLGDAVRKLRRAAHLTIPQLAKRAKVSSQTLSAIESGAEMRRESLVRIVHALGLADIPALDRLLDELCAERLAPQVLLNALAVSAEWREIVALWQEVLASPDPKSVEVCLWILRTEASRIRDQFQRYHAKTFPKISSRAHASWSARDKGRRSSPSVARWYSTIFRKCRC